MYENPDETSSSICPHCVIIEIRIEIKGRTYLLVCGFGCLKLQEWISKWFEKYVGRRLFQLWTQVCIGKVHVLYKGHKNLAKSLSWFDVLNTVNVKSSEIFHLIFSAFLKNLNCTKKKGKYAIEMIGTQNSFALLKSRTENLSWN